MSWVDVAWLGVLGLSVAVGAVRGLLVEVLALLGWVAAWWVSRLLAPQVAPALPIGPAGSSLSLGAAHVLVFVVTLFAWGVLTWLLRHLVRASVLSGADRVLGAVFGAARGLLIALVLVWLVGLTPLARQPAWQASHGVAWLQAVWQGLRPLLPPVLQRHVPQVVDREQDWG
ncbi:MAG: CvpA family protein [Pseudomonadota bacterium]